MAISDWPEDDRPREKLLAKGPGTLSDAELLRLASTTTLAIGDTQKGPVS